MSRFSLSDSILIDFDGVKIRMVRDFCCLTDYLREKKIIYHIPSIFTSRQFRLTASELIGCSVEEKNTVASLKKSGFWKTTGARHTKSVWVEKNLFQLIAGYLDKAIVYPNYIRDEELFSNMLNGILNHIEIIPQKRIGRYFIDFYIPSKKIAIEYDERKHGYCAMMKKDNERMDFIKQAIGCEFIRVKVGEEYKGINEIIKKIYYEEGN